MNQALRWMLILGCLMLAILEAPRASALVAEDLGGPYREQPSVRTVSSESGPQALLANTQQLADPADARVVTGTK